MSLERKGNLLALALKKLAATTGQSFNELRVIVAIERAVARLEREQELSDHLIFKGGFVMLKALESPRFTKDLDATVTGLSKVRILSLVQKAMERDLDDGLWFGKAIIKELKHEGYPGVKFQVPFQIGTPPISSSGQDKLAQIDIDIAFAPASAILPIEQQAIMPSILVDTTPVTWSIYPPEYIFAEKLEALISLGSTSSRAKDIYDIPKVFAKCSDRSVLRSAISNTFSNRNTKLPNSFEQEIRTFDLSALKKAWPSVSRSVGLSFEDAWAILIELLQQLDSNQ